MVIGIPFMPEQNPHMTDTTPKKPRGRPKTLDDDSVYFHGRMTREQRDKLDRLGGAAWVRARIDEAPDPGEGSRAREAWLAGQMEQDK